MDTHTFTLESLSQTRGQGRYKAVLRNASSSAQYTAIFNKEVTYTDLLEAKRQEDVLPGDVILLSCTFEFEQEGILNEDDNAFFILTRGRVPVLKSEITQVENGFSFFVRNNEITDFPRPVKYKIVIQTEDDELLETLTRVLQSPSRAQTLQQVGDGTAEQDTHMFTAKIRLHI